MKLNLKPCPFCGGSVTIAQMNDGDQWWYFITTGNDRETRCHCRLFMESEKYGAWASKAQRLAIRHDLIERWNRRVTDEGRKQDAH